MKIVVCPDKFKGTIKAERAASIIERAALSVLPDADVVAVPLGDGGEGTASALGAAPVSCRVTGPNGTPVDSFYGVLGDRAVVELSAAAGLSLADPCDPLVTTTFGVGELVLAAASAGFEKITLALGGSATNDCGCGMAAACGVRFFDRGGEEFVPVGGTLSRVARIDASGLSTLVRRARITVMCDVDSPLYGPRGASFVYAPQKGADAAAVALLDGGLRDISAVILRDCGTDVSSVPGAGAAGGCGAGAVAFLGGTLARGIDAVLDAAGFDGIVAGADLVVTGEGKFDAQSVSGKAVSGVAARAKAAGVPVLVLCGKAEADCSALGGSVTVREIARFPVPDDRIAEYAEEFLFETARETIAEKTAVR